MKVGFVGVGLAYQISGRREPLYWVVLLEEQVHER